MYSEYIPATTSLSEKCAVYFESFFLFLSSFYVVPLVLDILGSYTFQRPYKHFVLRLVIRQRVTIKHSFYGFTYDLLSAPIQIILANSCTFYSPARRSRALLNTLFEKNV